MSQSLELSAGNLFNMIRGALLMVFIIMSVSLYPRRKENSILNSLFWLLTGLSTLVIFENLGLITNAFNNNEYLLNLKILGNLCFIPIVDSFLLKILIPDKITFRRAFLLLCPTIVLGLIYFVTYDKLFLILSSIYGALVAVSVFIFIVFVSVRYDRLLKNNFSNIDNRTVGWVRTIIYVFGAWYLLWALKTQIDNIFLDSAFTLYLIAIWILIYKHSIRHVMTFQTQELFDKPQKTTEEYSELIKEKLDSSLEEYMNTERVWLDSSLTLQNLALALDTNRTYLSEYFNKTLDTTFYDYLNSYRIKHACEILLLEQNLSIIQVGEKSGFNSLSTFLRAFEKNVGCTPAKYRKTKH